MRKVLWVGVAFAVVAVGLGAVPGSGESARAEESARMGAGAGAGVRAGGVARDLDAFEADLAHHGRVLLSAGHLTVRFTSENHGPSGVADATVRFDFSAPLAPLAQDGAAGAGQALPAGCLRGGERTVLCRTGALRPGGRGEETRLDLRTAGAPHEVVVRVDTAWNGGAGDLDPENHRHRVLAPDTGDPYVF
ncbi:hypothetical protein AB0O07_28300 [Streptomyces sp. NPDC093085]|uniref:hypothetical protein n=1 Tax=Streptomyces sp. NPDC093085 TaxID=3155068 RepID=UPI00343E2678